MTMMMMVMESKKETKEQNHAKSKIYPTRSGLHGISLSVLQCRVLEPCQGAHDVAAWPPNSVRLISTFTICVGSRYE